MTTKTIKRIRQQKNELEEDEMAFISKVLLDLILLLELCVYFSFSIDYSLEAENVDIGPYGDVDLNY